jgi:hypothetical protein
MNARLPKLPDLFWKNIHCRLPKLPGFYRKNIRITPVIRLCQNLAGMGAGGESGLTREAHRL